MSQQEAKIVAGLVGVSNVRAVRKIQSRYVPWSEVHRRGQDLGRHGRARRYRHLWRRRQGRHHRYRHAHRPSRTRQRSDLRFRRLEPEAPCGRLQHQHGRSLRRANPRRSAVTVLHTQTTVAGNTIDNTVTPSPQLPDGVTMSGVAPCATVYSYRVEQADGTLSGDAIEAAIESLAVDQIDVANYSIGVSCKQRYAVAGRGSPVPRFGQRRRVHRGFGRQYAFELHQPCRRRLAHGSVDC